MLLAAHCEAEEACVLPVLPVLPAHIAQLVLYREALPPGSNVTSCSLVFVGTLQVHSFLAGTLNLEV